MQHFAETKHRHRSLFFRVMTVIIVGRSHLVELGRLLRSAPRGPRPAEALVLVSIHQGEDDEERVVRMLQTGSADQL